MPYFDSKDRSRYATFSRRSVVLGGGMTAVFGVLAGRLYQLQIVEGDLYMTRAEDNRISERLLAPPRGRIFDRFGVILAGNRRNYRVLIVPEQTRDGLPEALTELAKVIPLSDRAQARILKEASQNKPFVPIVVAENLAWGDFARLNLDLPYLQGVQPDVGETRDYPFGAELSHVLGYVAKVSPADLKDAARPNDPLLGLSGFRIGKRGIEKEFDGEIRGHAGTSRVEVNAYGRVIRELTRTEGKRGDDIYLTIDRELQHFVHQRLAGESAACVVMDVDTGDVLALTSTPGFDPNLFNTGLTTEEWNALVDNDHKPLLNKALAGAYPPGSTFKPVTALSALGTGAITPDFHYTCTGVVTLGGHDFHCWKRGGHGRLNLHQAIKYSCDCYFYEVARRTGIDALSKSARHLGLGKATGIELPGERDGCIPDRAWKEATFHRPWQQGETLIAGIGQGYILTTPLQLCALAARIASGRLVNPRIVKCRADRLEPRPSAPPIGAAADALAAVRAGMAAVTNEPGGTAYPWRITQKGMEMAGKTGTAQVRNITKKERATGVVSNADLAWKLRDHALFIAFAPLDKPRYACSVVVEHGAVIAHPQVQLARDLLVFAQQRDIVHLRTAYPVASAGPADPVGEAG